LVLFYFASCKDDKKPNYQYMPNMYESVAYETYSESNAFNSPTGLKGKEGQLPPDGTIKEDLYLMNIQTQQKDITQQKQL
jgi:hypothetical protein